jgi:hypothetical protein
VKAALVIAFVLAACGGRKAKVRPDARALWDGSCPGNPLAKCP